MGHSGSTGNITEDLYSKTWRDERVEAVSRVVEAVFSEPDVRAKSLVNPLLELSNGETSVDWELFGNARQFNPSTSRCK
jgi:hypothetical protein